MKITKMVMSQKDNKKIHIYADDSYYITLDVEVVYKLHLNTGKELDLELIDSLKNEEDFCECYNKSVNLISRCLKTKKQVKDYLYQKGYSKEIVERCLEKLEYLKLIDDNIYCKKYIEQEKNKKGKRAILNLLVSKGIDKNIVEKNLQDIIDNQQDAIKILIEKYMNNKDKRDIKNIQKLKRHLLSKGFSYDEINSCIGECDESWD